MIWLFQKITLQNQLRIRKHGVAVQYSSDIGSDIGSEYY